MDRIWRMFCLELLLITIFATVYNNSKANAKTIVNDGNLRIIATKDHGDTALKFSDGRTHRYDFQGKIKVVLQRKLTARMLRNRRNKTIYIEKVNGRVINNRLDGRTSTGGYISYQSLRGKVHKGNYVTTYLIYSPYTTWLDDIDERYDVIVR